MENGPKCDERKPTLVLNRAAAAQQQHRDSAYLEEFAGDFAWVQNSDEFLELITGDNPNSAAVFSPQLIKCLLFFCGY